MKQSTREHRITGHTVLIVEDMTIVAHELEFILKRLKCTVVGPVGRVDEAMTMLRDRDDVEVVILDINLHGLSSFPIADELISRNIPFIFTTGYGRESIPAQFQHHPRLEKPFGIDDLAQCLAELFDDTK